MQSKDFYRSPFTETADLIFETQFLELLLDMSPEERSGLYQSIEEAIEAHNRDFEREKTG